MTLSTSIFSSLDGRIDADADWQYPWFDGELFQVLGEQWSSAEALLVGRRTFEGYERLVAEHPESPMVGLLQSLPVTVISATRDASEALPHADFVDTVSAETIGALQREHSRVLLLGSPTLLASLIESGALTELSLIVLPIVVGHGMRLFESTGTAVAFETRDVRRLGNGVVLLHLEVDRAPR